MHTTSRYVFGLSVFLILTRLQEVKVIVVPLHKAQVNLWTFWKGKPVNHRGPREKAKSHTFDLGHVAN